MTWTPAPIAQSIAASSASTVARSSRSKTLHRHDLGLAGLVADCGRDRRAVAQPIDRIAAEAAVGGDAHPRGHCADVGMRGVDAAVDHRDPHAAAGRARVVGGAHRTRAETGERHALTRLLAPVKSRAKTPPLRASDSGDPVSTSRAPSRTATRSAAIATASRCEMTIEVRPRITAW